MLLTMQTDELSVKYVCKLWNNSNDLSQTICLDSMSVDWTTSRSHLTVSVPFSQSYSLRPQGTAGSQGDSIRDGLESVSFKASRGIETRRV